MTEDMKDHKKMNKDSKSDNSDFIDDQFIEETV